MGSQVLGFWVKTCYITHYKVINMPNATAEISTLISRKSHVIKDEIDIKLRRRVDFLMTT